MPKAAPPARAQKKISSFFQSKKQPPTQQPEPSPAPAAPAPTLQIGNNKERDGDGAEDEDGVASRRVRRNACKRQLEPDDDCQPGGKDDDDLYAVTQSVKKPRLISTAAKGKKQQPPTQQPESSPAARKSGGAKERDDGDEDEDEDEVISRPVRRRASKRQLDPDPDGDYQQPVQNRDDEGDDDDDDDLYTVTRPVKALRLASSPSTAAGKKKQQSASRFHYDPAAHLPSPDAMDISPATVARDGGGDGDGEDEDPVRKRQKALLRERFVKKLGKLPIARSSQLREEETRADGEGEAEGEGQDDEAVEPGPIAKRFGASVAATTTKKAAAGKKAPKLTPLEQQVVDIKKKHPDTILVVEVGYKFRFFGEDARVASQNLSIMCIPGRMRFDGHRSEAHLDKFASASIPVHRLHVHVKRLIAHGYKVGVVRQLETAALKAAGDNKSGPFERKLTNLYTKGTYVDDIDALDGPAAAGSAGDPSSGAGSGGAPNTGFLLAVTETPAGGTGADEKVRVGIIAVQPATGEVVYDEFDDGFMRGEIETRLLHIAPCEFLIVGELTKATEKIVSHLAGSTTTVFGDKVRVERVDRSKSAAADASTHVSKFYANKVQLSASPDSAGKNKLLDEVMDLPGLVTVCLSAMITHLTDYGLEHVFDLTKYFQSFSGRSHMLLNGNTLSSLEIYRNQTDYTTKGSLLWTLDRTKTKFGRRLLRNWVGRPLLDRQRLEERVQAVEEMVRGGDNPKLEQLKALLTKISYDLERGLIRIYYGKCTRPELLAILQTMLRISTTFGTVDEPADVGFQSDIINRAMAALPDIKDDVAQYLDMFDHRAAAKDDKYLFFKGEAENDEYEGIVRHKLGISAVEEELEDHKQDISKQLKGRKINYITVSGIEYLVELPNDKAMLRNVPASWVKISGTKKVDRYQTPQIMALIRERDQHKESLAAECDRAFKRFLARIATKYQAFRDCVHSLAVLDCLLSLAAVASLPGYVKPEFSNETVIEVAQGRHPMVEQLLLDAYVPNDIALSQRGRRAMLVTGPNMGGKSSYVRQVALIAIMAQIGSYVPAASARLGLLDAVYTRMGAFDNMLAGESTFMVELSETAAILRHATPRSLVILDELGRGTSTHDGVAIAHAVLDYIVQDLGALLLFVTHYPLLSRFGELYPDAVVNAHMAFEEMAAEGTGGGGGGEDITFLYRVGEGVAHRSYGLNVARLAGLPRGCLEVAAVKSRLLEDLLKEREGVRWARAVAAVAEGGGGDVDIEALAASLQFLDDAVE